MVNVDESVPRSVQIVDTDDHSDAEECSLFLLIFFLLSLPGFFFSKLKEYCLMFTGIAIEHDPESPQVCAPPDLKGS